MLPEEWRPHWRGRLRGLQWLRRLTPTGKRSVKTLIRRHRRGFGSTSKVGASCAGKQQHYGKRHETRNTHGTISLAMGAQDQSSPRGYL
jgi:hypothetical protein